MSLGESDRYAPVERRLVSDSVHQRLRADILTGKLGPGEALPSERTLSDSFAVNRHAIREAIKRLQQAGLVEVAHGEPSRIRDWRRTGGLDLLVDLAEGADGDRLVGMVAAVLEMRASIGADAARLCARRAGDHIRDGLQHRIGGLDGEGDFEPAFAAYEELWELIVEGADNLAYRLALNSLMAAPRHGALDATVYEPEVRDVAAQKRLIEAIVAGDASVAELSARELLARAVEAVAAHAAGEDAVGDRDAAIAQRGPSGERGDGDATIRGGAG